ncbi:PINK1 [Mytilus edulis]|uniref:non-specific serine/threonine protein kinase n=1 Tax=Mytilus edulis TaxID=6550 RepID=A0A8S3Q152_MYTED|nr:PINK1 [Mytilus edulis]
MNFFKSATRTVRTTTDDGSGPRTETKTYSFGDDGPSIGYGGGGNIDIGFGQQFGGGKKSFNISNFIGGGGGSDGGSGGGRRTCIRQPSQRPQVGGRASRKEKKNPFSGLNNQSYDNIKKMCLEEGILFEDPEFPAQDDSIFFSRAPNRPFVWKRPVDLVDSPEFIASGVSRFDVKQGELGRNRVRLKSLPQHPNIVDMIGAFVDPFNVPQLSVAMETYPAALPKRLYSSGLGRNMTMYIVMKKYDMTLREYLEQHKPDVRTRCLLLTQLLEGIVHLGNHGIAHRDIKTDNMFLEISEQSVPKLVIGDFGCCLADTEYGQKIPYFTSDTDRGGNCSLMAPEISTAIPGKDIWLDYSKADLWAVGTIIYELFSMDNPFYGNQSGQGLQDSRTYREQDLPSLPDTVPHIVKLLVRLCLSRDPTKRPTPTDAANLMQIYLWFPEWFVFKPDLSGIKEHLLVLTAQVILHGKHMAPGDQLMSTFLQRLKLEDIIRIVDNYAEVE